MNSLEEQKGQTSWVDSVCKSDPIVLLILGLSAVMATCKKATCILISFIYKHNS